MSKKAYTVRDSDDAKELKSENIIEDEHVEIDSNSTIISEPASNVKERKPSKRSNGKNVTAPERVKEKVGEPMELKVVASGSDENAILGRTRNETLIVPATQEKVSVDEPGPGTKDDIKRVGSIIRMQDIVDAISVVISSGAGIKPEKIAEFIDILDMRVAKPRLIGKFDAQV